jgi:hypothetical protein
MHSHSFRSKILIIDFVPHLVTLSLYSNPHKAPPPQPQDPRLLHPLYTVPSTAAISSLKTAPRLFESISWRRCPAFSEQDHAEGANDVHTVEEGDISLLTADQIFTSISNGERLEVLANGA